MLVQSQFFLKKNSFRVDKSSFSVTFDQSKCSGCNSCVRACSTIAGQNVLALEVIGEKKVIKTRINKNLSETNCVGCGQCTVACGPGAFTEVSDVPVLQKILGNKKDKIVVAQTAPAIRINLSEMLGFPVGTNTTGKLVSVLKRIGFDYVFDTAFSADLTIVEEANELVERLKKGGVFPMFTSCCPAWVNYVEKSVPSLIPNLSSCKSPMSMLGAVLKSDFVKIKGVNQSDVISVSIMPCTAKKDEIQRAALTNHNGIKDNDLVITTRELARLVKKLKINYKSLPDEKYDKLYAYGTGAGVIFGSSGGVMEAACRSAYQFVTGKNIEKLEFETIRAGKDGIKYAELNIDGTKIKVAVCQGLGNAMKLVKKINSKDPELQNLKFVEVMACPGGCVNGGGSPRAKSKKAVETREQSLYAIDSAQQIRLSHENPEIIELYQRFLKKYGSHEAHELLHTKFTNRKK